jgi:GNAT superfamily N-acetyltransferase
MHCVPYVYVRSLELEGRHPHDVGQWGVTNMRLLYLEGLPDSLDEFMVPVNPDGTFQSSLPSRRKLFWPKRKRFYRRIRSAGEASQAIRLRGPDSLTKACIPLFSSWVNPPNGFISMPASGEPFAPDTHAVHLKKSFRSGGTVVDGVQDAPHFLFENSWGDQWGYHGLGMMPFAYYDRYAFEQWAIYNLDELKQVQIKKPSPGWVAWQGRDEFDRRVYAFEAGEPDRERLGWAFAIDTGTHVEVEELFVAPEARNQGIGRKLTDQVAQLARARSLPLRLWVTFADTKRESATTASALPSIAKRLGVKFVHSPVPWAAYYAASEHPGSLTPIEPDHFPGRPKSTRGALNAFFAGMGLAVGSATAPVSTTEQQAIVTSHASGGFDSPEWKAKNARRAALIRKKNRGGLNDEERAEFDYLQATAREMVEGASHRPHLYAPEIEAILAAKAPQ